VIVLFVGGVEHDDEVSVRRPQAWRHHCRCYTSRPPCHVITEMGGPRALISTETSVTGLLRTMSGLNEESSESFLNYDGAVFPW